MWDAFHETDSTRKDFSNRNSSLIPVTINQKLPIDRRNCEKDLLKGKCALIRGRGGHCRVV